jgi:hypothetical protein
MTLQQKIREEIKNAMRAKDEVRLTTLRGMLSAFTNESVTLGKTPQDELSDDQAIIVIKRLAKQRKDSIEQFTKGGRPDLADNEKVELLILEKFLPEQMGEEDIKKIIKLKIESLRQAQGDNNSPLDKGKLIGLIIKECKGQADGTLVKRLVEELI